MIKRILSILLSCYILLLPISAAEQFRFQTPLLYTGVQTTTVDVTSEFLSPQYTNSLGTSSLVYSGVDNLTRTFDDVIFDNIPTVTYVEYDAASNWSYFDALIIDSPYYSVFELYNRPIFQYFSLYILVNVYSSVAPQEFPEGVSFLTLQLKIPTDTQDTYTYIDIPVDIVGTSYGSSTSSYSYLFRASYISSEPIYFHPQTHFWFYFDPEYSVVFTDIDIGFPAGFLGVSDYYSEIYGSDPNWEQIFRDIPSIDLLTPPDFSGSTELRYITDTIFSWLPFTVCIIPIAAETISWMIGKYILNKGV